jgi:hypothetical protein
METFDHGCIVTTSFSWTRHNIASIIGMRSICLLATTLAVTSNWRTLRRIIDADYNFEVPISSLKSCVFPEQCYEGTPTYKLVTWKCLVSPRCDCKGRYLLQRLQTERKCTENCSWLDQKWRFSMTLKKSYTTAISMALYEWSPLATGIDGCHKRMQRFLRERSVLCVRCGLSPLYFCVYSLWMLWKYSTL